MFLPTSMMDLLSATIIHKGTYIVFLVLWSTT
jgi:hypothetical protein